MNTKTLVEKISNENAPIAIGLTFIALNDFERARISNSKLSKVRELKKKYSDFVQEILVLSVECMTKVCLNHKYTGAIYRDFLRKFFKYLDLPRKEAHRWYEKYLDFAAIKNKPQ